MNRIRRVQNRMVRGVAEVIESRGHVVRAPLGGAVSLGNLIGDEMPEDREFVGESMINARDFLTHIGGRIVAADELEAAGGLRKNAGCKQRCRVEINHARW